MCGSRARHAVIAQTRVDFQGTQHSRVGECFIRHATAALGGDSLYQ
jgi:hypothetical protein